MELALMSTAAVVVVTLALGVVGYLVDRAGRREGDRS